MVDVLIGEIDLTVRRLEMQRWVYTDTITVVVITMIVQAFNHSVQSESRGVAQAYVVVKLPTYLSKAVNIQRRLSKLTI